MLRIARACLALMLASAACGDDGEADPSLGTASVDATTQLDPALAGQDASAVSAPEASLDAGAVAAPQDAANPANSAADAGAAADASKPAPRPPLVLEVPKANVTCGGSPCDTLANVCCGSWSAGKGFGSALSCVPRAKCYDDFERAGDQNRAIPQECDGKEDCSGGQVCCLIADSQPLCELADLAMCTSKLLGPGGGGLCTDDALCKLGSIQFVAEGVPLGILACNDDSDCQDRKGTTCQPEQDGTLTTGKGIKARSYVKVCR